MTKNIQHVSFHPIEHAWVGDHEINKKDNWVELGHFLRGMEIVGEPVVEQDGRKRFQEALGYLLSGTFQNIQNTVGELQFYRKVLNGTKNFAFRNGSVLTLFRLYQVAPGVVGDNRASFKLWRQTAEGSDGNWRVHRGLRTVHGHRRRHGCQRCAELQSDDRSGLQ
jgi:hypothetical protein